MYGVPALRMSTISGSSEDDRKQETLVLSRLAVTDTSTQDNVTWANLSNLPPSSSWDGLSLCVGGYRGILGDYNSWGGGNCFKVY